MDELSESLYTIRGLKKAPPTKQEWLDTLELYWSKCPTKLPESAASSLEEIARLLTLADEQEVYAFIPFMQYDGTISLFPYCSPKAMNNPIQYDDL